MNDLEAIRKIKSGKIEHFEYLVKKYTKQVYGFVKRKLFRSEDVDDVVQEIFIQLYKAMNRFDEKRPVQPYLFEIVRSRLKMYYRSHKQESRLNEDMTAAVVSDEISDVSGFLKKLPPEQKRALELVAEGYSYDEIAQKLKKPLNTIRTIIHRARLKVVKLQTT